MPWVRSPGLLATADEAVEIFTELIDAYPTEALRFRNAGVNLTQTGKFYAEEFQRYPADWVREALKRLRRERPQFPSIADVCAQVRVVGGWVNG